MVFPIFRQSDCNLWKFGEPFEVSLLLLWFQERLPVFISIILAQMDDGQGACNSEIVGDFSDVSCEEHSSQD